MWIGKLLLLVLFLLFLLFLTSGSFVLLPLYLGTGNTLEGLVQLSAVSSCSMLEHYPEETGFFFLASFY